MPRALPALLAAAFACLAGCPDRTSVGDESVQPRAPWEGGWYDECSEPQCAQSCRVGERLLHGECTWTGEELVCRCLGHAAEPCEADACASSCTTRDYHGSLCDSLGCRCFHLPASDADAAEEADAAAEDDG